MAFRISETKLNQLVRELPVKDFKALKQRLACQGTKAKNYSQKSKILGIYRRSIGVDRKSAIKKVGCTEKTYRTHRSEIVNTLLNLLVERKQDPIFLHFANLEKAWLLSSIGEHRAAFDLAAHVCEVSKRQERSAIARLALEVMTSNAQEAYPKDYVGKVDGLRSEMLQLAINFHHSTDLYDIYFKLGFLGNKTFLLRTSSEEARWRALKHRVSAYQNRTDLPFNQFAYCALSHHIVHHLKGNRSEAYEWYHRLWLRMNSDSGIIEQGDKRFLATFQTYISAAIASDHLKEENHSNALFLKVIHTHHSTDLQQIAVQRYFELQILEKANGNASIRTALASYISEMDSALESSPYYHQNWSPHIKYEMLFGLFNSCFRSKQFRNCRLILKWGVDREERNDTSADFPQMASLLQCTVSIEESKKKGKLLASKMDEALQYQTESCYNRYRKKKETQPIEYVISHFFHRLVSTDQQKIPALTKTARSKLLELKQTAFYYPNFMYYFNYEEWLAQ